VSAPKLTTAEFEVALKADLPLLVDFYADWCGPCKMMAPVVAQLVTEQAGVLAVHSLDVDTEPTVAQRYGVMGIPSLILFKQGKLADKLVGYPGPAGVRAWLAKAMA
jgi:thioredoxin 1